jgi:predicted dehydrogenase/nucleoside-diphosphate-sugar epimerase
MEKYRDVERWLIVGTGAVARECFLPAFEYLNVLPNLTAIDLIIPRELRLAYPSVDFVEGDFERYLYTKPHKVQAAIVALPNRLHERAVLRLLQAGLHVLCEKPLALTEASCLRMRELAEKAQRRLSVNMIRRFFPSVRSVRQLVQDGEIGRINAIQIEHGGAFVWPAQSLSPFFPENGGVFADMGVHYIDLAESLVGQLQLRSYWDDSHGGVEAEAIADFESTSGTAVHIHLSRLKELGNTITLHGAEGRIVLPVDSLSSFNVYRPSCGEGIEVRPLQPFRSTSLPASFPACFVEQLKYFKSQIEAGDVSTDDCNGAVRVARIIEEAYQRRSSVTSTSNPGNLKPAPTLITGVTGFIGGHLAERLLKCGFSEITGVVRRPQTCAPIARYPLKLHIANLLDFDSVRKEVQGQRYVFHLAYGRDGADAEAVTLQGTKNVVNAAIEGECEAVIILSTVNVLGWPNGENTEDAPYRPAGGTYGKAKAAMERWCLKRARQSKNTKIILLLPSCVYGPNGKTFTELPAKLASQQIFAWISNGSGIANYVYVDNLIDAMLLVARSPQAHGQRFIVNDGWTTWRDFLRPIVAPWLSEIRNYEVGELARLNAETRRGAIKRALRTVIANADVRRELNISPLGSLARKLANLTGVLSPAAAEKFVSLSDQTASTISDTHPPAWIEDIYGFHETCFSSSKIRGMCGWTPLVDLHQGQCLSIEYLRSAGLYPDISDRIA